MREKDTFNIDVDRKTMEDYNTLIDFVAKNYPFVTDELWKLNHKFSNIRRHGCFIHNVVCESIRIGDSASQRICPKCSPKEYKESVEAGKKYRGEK